MSGKMRKLTDKYFVKEDDGYHINKEACKESATTVAIDTMLLGIFAVGGLAVIGLATIGVKTIVQGARTVRDGASYVTEHFRK